MSLNIPATTRVSAWAACSIVPLALTMAFATAARAQSGPPIVSLKDHPGWVQVPGALVRPDCVFEVPNEAQVGDNGDIIVNGALWAHYDDCPEAPVLTRPVHRVAPLFSDAPGTINGWVEAV